MKNRVLGLRFLEDMNHTPYRRITALLRKAHSKPVNELNADGSIINLSTLKVRSKTFTLIDRKQNAEAVYRDAAERKITSDLG